MSTKDLLIAVRDQFQSLLDYYQVTDPGLVTFKSAMVQLNSIIETPDAPPVTITQPVTSTADVVAGVLAGLGDIPATVLAGLTAPLSTMSAAISALTPAAPTPAVLAPSADQVAAAQAVIGAGAATAAAVPAAAAPAASGVDLTMQAAAAAAQ